MKTCVLVHSSMSHVLIGYSLVCREVALTVTDTTVNIDHHYLTVSLRFPPRHALNTRSPWIEFFARKFVRGEFVFAGAVAGYIVSRFLTHAERFATWDAVHGIPHSITQRAAGFNFERHKEATATGVYNYETRKLTISKTDGSFNVIAYLPPEAAFPFGVTWKQ